MGQNVKFAGHVITDQGTKPNHDTVAAIKDYPEPDNLTDLQSFMGLANQFGEYSPDLRHAMEPLRPLLKKKTPIPGGKTTPRQWDIGRGLARRYWKIPTAS